MNYSINAALYKTKNPDKPTELETVKTLSFNHVAGDKTTTSTATELKAVIKEKLNVPDIATIKIKGIKDELADNDIVTDYNVYYTATIPGEVVLTRPDTKKFPFKS